MIYQFKQTIKNLLGGIIRDETTRAVNHFVDVALKSSAQIQIQQKQLFACYQDLANTEPFINVRDLGFRVFSQFDEDGILLYIFSVIGMKCKTFVDIGSSDGINSNCANFAINFGWDGLFIDGSEYSLEKGRKFYNDHPNTWIYPPKFISAMVKRDNINDIIKEAGFEGDIDLLSIDIDGNDYWVWDALEIVQPRVVIIETHVEFGKKSIVVPYDPDYCYPGKHEHYHGASPSAMIKLAKKKGYRLVATNQYGFNTIYVKKQLGKKQLPTIGVDEVLKHPRNIERQKLFKEVKDYKYLKV